MVYQTAPVSMTLEAPNPVFKVTPLVDAEYFINAKDTAIVATEDE